jgi:hypothetical protein
MAASHRKAPDLTGWQLTAVIGAVVVLSAALLAAAIASSYDSVWHLAVARHVPVPRLTPLELDGGLIVVTLADIATTWLGHPFGGLRWLARLLGLATVAANIAAGWPDPVGGFLRAFAPAIIVVLAEAVRALLLRRDEDAWRDRERRHDERIPRIRWLLAPWPTFILWRRMRLWDIRSYPAAVDMELSRRHAIVKLSECYGQAWQAAAPADLVWMLRRGVRMAEALARVADLTAPEPGREPVAIAPMEPAHRVPRSAPRPRRTTRGSAHDEDLTTELRAVQLLDADPDLRKPRMGAELARRLGVSESYGGKLHRRLTAEVRPSEPGQDCSGERSAIASGDRSPTQAARRARPGRGRV